TSPPRSAMIPSSACSPSMARTSPPRTSAASRPSTPRQQEPRLVRLDPPCRRAPICPASSPRSRWHTRRPRRCSAASALNNDHMRFARIVFRVAGIWGFVILTPIYFMYDRIGQQYPPPLTHPDFFYGFIGVALVWQVAFLIISTDPVRFRPMMIAAMLEKF